VHKFAVSSGTDGPVSRRDRPPCPPPVVGLAWYVNRERKCWCDSPHCRGKTLRFSNAIVENRRAQSALTNNPIATIVKIVAGITIGNLGKTGLMRFLREIA